MRQHLAAISIVVGSDPKEFCLSCEDCDLFVGPTTDHQALEDRLRQHVATARTGEHETAVTPAEDSDPPRFWLTCDGCDLKVGPSLDEALLADMGRKHEQYVSTVAMHRA